MTKHDRSPGEHAALGLGSLGAGAGLWYGGKALGDHIPAAANAALEEALHHEDSLEALGTAGIHAAKRNLQGLGVKALGGLLAVPAAAYGAGQLWDAAKGALSSEKTAELEQEKRAFGLPEAQKVLQVAKARTLPRRYLEEAVAAALPPYMQGVGRTMARERGISALAPPRRAAQFRQLMGMPDMNFGKTTGIQPPRRGDVMSSFGRSVKGPKVPMQPEHRMTLDAIAKGHELDEMALPVSHAVAGAGHVNPRVLFREHNKVVTLPPELQPAGDAMRRVRDSTHESTVLNEALAPFGFTYGQGERLSPSMQRAMTQHLETQFPTPQAFGEALAAHARKANAEKTLATYGVTPEELQKQLEGLLNRGDYSKIPQRFQSLKDRLRNNVLRSKTAMRLEFDSPEDMYGHIQTRERAGQLGKVVGGGVLGAMGARRWGLPGAVAGGLLGGYVGDAPGKLVADVAHDYGQRTHAAARLDAAAGFGHLKIAAAEEPGGLSTGQKELLGAGGLTAGGASLALPSYETFDGLLADAATGIVAGDVAAAQGISPRAALRGLLARQQGRQYRSPHTLAYTRAVGDFANANPEYVDALRRKLDMLSENIPKHALRIGKGLLVGGAALAGKGLYDLGREHGERVAAAAPTATDFAEFAQQYEDGTEPAQVSGFEHDLEQRSRPVGFGHSSSLEGGDDATRNEVVGIGQYSGV